MGGKRKLEREEERRIWEEHLREWESSGLTQAEYCRREDLKLKSFAYRKRTLKPEADAICLVEAPVRALSIPKPGPSTIRLFWGDRLRIEIDRDFDPDTLRRLVEVLGQ